MERGQDVRLVPLAQEVMAKAGVTYNDLDRIAVTRGPGSFTGLRIGLAAARGFGLAAGRPVLGIDRFTLYREQHKLADSDLLVVLESKRLELYCRLYLAKGEPQEDRMLPPDDIAALAHRHPQLKVTGDAQEVLRKILPAHVAYPAYEEPEIVTCASLAARADINDSAYLPRPYYLRAPDVTMAKNTAGPTCGTS